jgi:uncharacterized membrane protein YjgN (DUF898 family)
MTTLDEGAATAPARPVELNVDNKSSILEFLWIGFYSSLLMLPTLTLFRFWGRTIVRRKLWSQTTIGGEPLEYTGKGSELFVGFLIALVTVVLPMAALLFGAQAFLGPAVFGLVFVAIYIALPVLVGAAIYLARRYQLSRTVWRGVRLELRGSPFEYGFAMLGYGILTGLTFGWFAPAMTLRLERLMWSNTYFGDTPFDYDNTAEARTEPVYMSFALAFVGLIIFYVMVFAGAFALGTAGGDPSQVDIGRVGALPLIFAGAGVLALFSAWHQASLLRQITKSISLQGVRLRSTIGVWDIIELAITNTLLVIFTLGFGVVAAQMRVWRRVCTKLSVEGALDFAQIEQAASRGPRSGEGMADAFDISGGI